MENSPIFKQYTIYVDDLLSHGNDSTNHVEICVVSRDYKDAYDRTMRIIPAVFPADARLQYKVFEGTVDDNKVGDDHYSVNQYKTFYKRSLPKTLKAFHAADEGE